MVKHTKGTYQIGCQCARGCIHDIPFMDEIYDEDFRPTMQDVVEQAMGIHGDTMWRHLLSPVKCGAHWVNYGMVSSCLAGPKLPGRGLGHAAEPGHHGRGEVVIDNRPYPTDSAMSLPTVETLLRTDSETGVYVWSAFKAGVLGLVRLDTRHPYNTVHYIEEEDIKEIQIGLVLGNAGKVVKIGYEESTTKFFPINSLPCDDEEYLSNAFMMDRADLRDLYATGRGHGRETR